VPVTATAYWPAVVPVGGGGGGLLPPPPQLATPMRKSRTATASAAPANARGRPLHANDHAASSAKLMSTGMEIGPRPSGKRRPGRARDRANVLIVSLDVAGFWPGVTELGLKTQVGMYCAWTCTVVVTAHVKATAFAKPNAPVAEIVEVVELPALTVAEGGVADRLKSGVPAVIVTEPEPAGS